jgi:hypothetical protein
MLSIQKQVCFESSNALLNLTLLFLNISECPQPLRTLPPPLALLCPALILLFILRLLWGQAPKPPLLAVRNIHLTVYIYFKPLLYTPYPPPFQKMLLRATKSFSPAKTSPPLIHLFLSKALPSSQRPPLPPNISKCA